MMSVTPEPYYRFRSRARYLRARGDFLGWSLTHQTVDGSEPFDLASLTADLPAGSPLITALEALPEPRRPQVLREALHYLRICLHLAEQEWPPAESLETTLAALRAPVVAATPAPLADAPAPISEAQVISPAPAPQRRSRFRWLRGFVGLALILTLLWISLRATQAGIERQSIAADLHESLPDFQVSLSGLSLSLPAQAAACIEANAPRCLMDARGPAYGDRLRTDLVQAQDTASRMLADLSPLAGSDSGALWFVSAAGENCALTGADVLDTDRDLVAGLCRVRERLTEYDLCLSGHPAISDRQCRDLMRLAVADTLFDCTNCGDRPANVFDQRIEWTSELKDAAGLVLHAQQFAAPDRMGQVAWRRLTRDALWLTSQVAEWRDQMSG